MAKITLKGNPINTIGELPAVGQTAKDFNLAKADLGRVNLDYYKGKRLVLNIFPSLDTGTCALSVQRFNQIAATLNNTLVLCISRDLPFAHGRFCKTEGLNNIITLSDFETGAFGKDYGLEIIDGILKGLHSRAVIIIDENCKVIYTQQVPEIVDEPNYDKVLEALKQ
ncbi:MAG: thiol peroxidase [Bacteroidales bacterium]|nr:thiol peroxidase [Bacteroidales bacterium]